MALSAPWSQEGPAWQLSPGNQFSSQLAAAVRSINWTYAIFWSISASRPGVLTWKDGFYNGKIKTRKMTNVPQRSEQLRELYESLRSGGCHHRARWPVASLSPEDLGDAEWYYTVCMTYAFRPGQGLPGKSLASNEQVWLCNAPFADAKIFQRALLAKAASIQTVACIPFMGGVLELGTADQVLEDTDMMNRIGSSFWEVPFPIICSESQEPSAPSPNETGQTDIMLEDLDHNVVEDMMMSLEIECLSNGNFARITNEIGRSSDLCEELDVCTVEHKRIVARSLGGITDDVVPLTSFVESSRSSCFTSWKRSSDSGDVVALVARKSQKLLKKALAGGAWFNDGGGGTARSHESDIKGHIMTDRRRREKLNEMFMILKSLVPSIQKVDKHSILAGTIAYLKELEQLKKLLQSSRALTGPTERETTGLRHHNVTGKKAYAGSKRKTLELGDTAVEIEHCHRVLSKDDDPINVVNVTVVDKEVLMEVQCRWKELLMTRVFDAIKVLSLDVLSVQASTPLGFLALKIQAQYVGAAAVSPGMISKALQKAIGEG